VARIVTPVAFIIRFQFKLALVPSRA